MVAAAPQGVGSSQTVASTLSQSELGDQSKAGKAAISAQYNLKSCKLWQLNLEGLESLLAPRVAAARIAIVFMVLDVPMSAPGASPNAADDGTIAANAPQGTNTSDITMDDDDDDTIYLGIAGPSTMVGPTPTITTHEGGATKAKKPINNTINVDKDVTTDGAYQNGQVGGHLQESGASVRRNTSSSLSRSYLNIKIKDVDQLRSGSRVAPKPSSSIRPWRNTLGQQTARPSLRLVGGSCAAYFGSSKWPSDLGPKGKKGKGKQKVQAQEDETNKSLKRKRATSKQGTEDAEDAPTRSDDESDQAPKPKKRKGEPKSKKGVPTLSDEELRMDDQRIPRWRTVSSASIRALLTLYSRIRLQFLVLQVMAQDYVWSLFGGRRK